MLNYSISSLDNKWYFCTQPYFLLQEFHRMCFSATEKWLGWKNYTSLSWKAGRLVSQSVLWALSQRTLWFLFLVVNNITWAGYQVVGILPGVHFTPCISSESLFTLHWHLLLIIIIRTDVLYPFHLGYADALCALSMYHAFLLLWLLTHLSSSLMLTLLPHLLSFVLYCIPCLWLKRK